VVGLPMPLTGTLGNLMIMSSAGPAFTSVSYQIQAQVYVNGLLTNIGCTITAGSIPNCSDAPDTAAVSPGSTVAVVLTFINTPTVLTVPVGALSIHASLTVTQAGS
jgi:hypothetical protein